MIDKIKNDEDELDRREAGASHGDVTGAWRVVRNGILFGIAALIAVALFAG